MKAEQPWQGAVDKAVTAGIIAILVAAPTQYSLQIIGGVNVSIVDPLVWAVGGLWFVRLLQQREVRWVKSVPVVTLLFVIMGIASAVRAGNRLAAVKDLIQWVEYFGVAFLLFVSAFERRLKVKHACYVFLSVGTVITAWGLAEYMLPSVQDFDVSASFGNRNVLGGFFSLLLPFAFGWILWDRSWARRIWFGLILVAGLVATLAGGSLIAVLFAMAVLSLVRGQVVFVVFAVAATLFLAVTLSVLPRENAWPLHDSIAIFESDASAVQRYPEWQAALVMAEENPFLGVGVGNYQENIGRYYGTLPSIAKKAEADSQNLYLVLASSIGLPGLLLFLATLVYFISKGFAGLGATGDGEGWEKAVAAGSAAALLAFAVNCVWAPLLVRGIGIPLVFMMALALWAGARSLRDESVDSQNGREA